MNALLLILAFAAVTFASHFLFPSVRWFFRRRMERAVARLNERLEREGRMDMAKACFRFLPDRALLDLEGWPEEDIFAH